MIDTITINLDATTVPTDDVLNRYYVKISDLIEVGPAGGNPNFNITGVFAAVEMFFTDWYLGGYVGNEHVNIDDEIEMRLVEN
jgi:hypothetical protein